MTYPVIYTFQPAANGYICAAQQVVGATALTFNGTGIDVTSTTLLNNPRMTLKGSGFQRSVSLTSSGVTSGINFTIVGADIRGSSVTETIAGPATNTVQTTALFYEVYSVTTSATLGTNVSVGIGTHGTSQWFKCDYQMTPVNVGVGVTVSGTDLTWSLQQTMYNVEQGAPPANSIINSSDGTMVSQTVSRQGSYTIPFGASRIVVASSTNGSLVTQFYQAGIE